MKRTILILLALMMAVTCVPALADGTNDAPAWGVVKTASSAKTASLLSAPAAYAAEVADVYSGAFVRILEQTGSWLKVEVGTAPAQTLQGYIAAASVDSTLGTLTVKTPVVTVRNTSGGTGITLRHAPATENTAAYGVVPNGAQLTVLAALPGGWYMVQSGGITAYAAGFALNVSGTAASSGTGSSTAAVEEDPPFNGPTGAYTTAEWTYAVPDKFAVVSNPVATDRLNLREKADVNSASLGKYYNGVRVEIVSLVNEEWAQVKIGALEGYMKKEFLDFETPFPASGMPAMKVSNPNPIGNLHLRALPTTTAQSLGLYNNGTQVILLGFTADWAHVIVNGQMGFMMAKYLK